MVKCAVLARHAAPSYRQVQIFKVARVPFYTSLTNVLYAICIKVYRKKSIFPKFAFSSSSGVNMAWYNTAEHPV